ncbi:MAG: hypothetical protein ABI378_05390, partial [Chitinophagaceae bacterium]
DGNLAVTRTVAGLTNLYRNLGHIQSMGNSAIGGAFSYTNTVGGDFSMNGSNTTLLPIAGTVTITSTSNGAFHMYKTKNATAGGTVSVVNSNNLDIQNDTLKAVTVGFTGYTGLAQFFNNSFTGNTTITDDAAQNNNTNFIDGNLFAGNLAITHASVAEMDQGRGASGPGDYVTGNCIISLSGIGIFFAARYEDLKVGGNLTVSRTTAGYTNLYGNLGKSQSAGNSAIGGAFSYTNTVGGDFYLNTDNSTILPIGGEVNIASTSDGAFHMYKSTNATAGGAVSVENSNNLDIQNDTLRAVTFGFTAYTGPSTIYNNSFTGNTTIADDATQNNNTNYIDGNDFEGNLSITHTSIAEMDQGYGSAGPGDHVTGNCTITLSGGGRFVVALYEDLKVDGNLALSRTSAGFTNLYPNLGHIQSSGNSAIGGTFSYTNTAGGDFYLNNNNNTVLPIRGIINIASTAAGIFNIYKTSNLLSGGDISIANATSLDMRNDSLKSNVNITDYSGPLNVYDNSLTGTTVIADAAAQNNTNNYVDGNFFAGRFTLVHSSANAAIYDGYGSPSGYGNVVKGIDSIVNVTGAATLYVSYLHPHRADSTFVLNSPASTTTISSLSFGGRTGGSLRNVGTQALSIPYVTMIKTDSTTLTLQAPLTVTNTFTFTSGYLGSSTANPLTFANSAVQSGASNASHVTGPVIKVGVQAFTFPLGNGTYYSPAGITAPTNTTDAFTAQFYPIQPNLAGYDSNKHDASINHISLREYWIIDRTAGSSNVKVVLGYNRPASGAVTNMSQLTIAHWYNNGTLAWHDEGNSGTTGVDSMGTVTSNNTISSFSPFTLASTTTLNPLPITLSDFSVRRDQSAALLSWTLQTGYNVSNFDIQRSVDGSNWKQIGNVPTLGNFTDLQTYNFWDASPLLGNNFYRLGIYDHNNTESFSPVRTLFMDGLTTSEITIFPNPVNTVLHVMGSIRGLTLTNIEGRIIYRGTGDIDMNGIPQGMYLLEALDLNGNRTVFKVQKL